MMLKTSQRRDHHRKWNRSSQDRHSHCKPEVLLMGNVYTAQVPRSGGHVVRVTENCEHPCHGSEALRGRILG